jgi:hypothetical protein
VIRLLLSRPHPAVLPGRRRIRSQPAVQVTVSPLAIAKLGCANDAFEVESCLFQRALLRCVLRVRGSFDPLGRRMPE